MASLKPPAASVVPGAAAGGNSPDAMRVAFRALAGDSFVYLLGAVALGLGNFILVPLYTRYLVPAEFGVYALVDITVLVLVTVTQLKLDVSYLKWFADVDPAQRRSLLGSVLLTGAFASAMAGGLLALAVAAPIGQRWLQTEDRSFAWTLFPLVVLENLQGFFLTDLRARRRTVAYTSCSVARLLAIVGATVWFVAIRQQGVYGVFLGRLIGDAVSTAILAASCIRSFRLRFAKELLRPMTNYGLPLVWGSLMALLMDASGRYFLMQYSTLEQVGLYGAAIKISSVFQVLISQPFGVAWGGLMFQIARWPNARFVYSRVISVVCVVSMTGALLAALFTPTLFLLLASPAYAPAMAVFPLVLLVRAVNVLESPVSTGIAVVSKTKWFAVVHSFGLIVTLAANYVLVPAHGMFGVAAAWLMGWVANIAILTTLGQRYYPLDYEWKLLLLSMAPWILIVLEYDGFVQILSSMTWPSRGGLAVVFLLANAVLLIRRFGRRSSKDGAQ